MDVADEPKHEKGGLDYASFGLGIWYLNLITTTCSAYTQT
jgi:hypothetical protein